MIDQDDLDRTVQTLMSKHEANALRCSDALADGSVMLVLNTGEVYRYWPDGLVALTRIRMTEPITEAGDVQYVPFVDLDLGTVGYVVICDEETDTPRPITFIYFNPSNHADGADVPNVFVYKGPVGHPAEDTPQFHVVVWDDEQPKEQAA